MESGTIHAAQCPERALPLQELELLRRLALYSEDDARLLRRAVPRLLPLADDLPEVLLGLFAGLAAGANAGPAGVARAEAPDLPALQESFRRWLGSAGRWPWPSAASPAPALWRLFQQSSVSGATLAALAAVLVAPLVLVARPYLEQAASGVHEVEALQRAWTKAMVLQASLWARAAAEQAITGAEPVIPRS